MMYMCNVHVCVCECLCMCMCKVTVTARYYGRVLNESVYF
jgi:hypothetical protein